MDKALQVLKALEKQAEGSVNGDDFIPSIGPIKGEVLEDIIKKYKPKKILEMGTLFGYSSILMARLLPRNGKVITIEINKKYAEIAKKNIEAAGLSEKIEVMQGNAIIILAEIKEKFDLVFIDAAKKEYLAYLKLAEKKINKGGIVIADNAGIFKQEMLDYLDYVKNSGKYKSKTVKVPLEFHEDVEDAMEISIKV